MRRCRRTDHRTCTSTVRRGPSPPPTRARRHARDRAFPRGRSVLPGSLLPAFSPEWRRPRARPDARLSWRVTAAEVVAKEGVELRIAHQVVEAVEPAPRRDPAL